MKLLMVTPNFPPAIGGVQNYAEAMALAMHNQVEHFAVLAEKPSAADLPQSAKEYDRRYDFEVRRVPDPGDNFALSAALPLKTWLLREHFDAIFATHWSAAFCARLATRGNIPVGCAVHGKEVHIDPLRRVPALRRGYRYARKSAIHNSVLFPVSQYTAATVRQHFPRHGPIQVVGNGVDTSIYHPLEASERKARAGRPIVLTVGRLVARKGVDNVLRALAMLESVPFEYWVVGDGPARAGLEQLSTELGLAERVKFFGSVAHEDLVGFYNDSDVFVMTPRDINGDVEGFGLVFLEAAACGKPVIGSRSGGVPDAVQDERNGYLVTPDAPEELCERLQELLTDNDRRRAFGQLGIEHARANSWEHAAAQILQTLESECV